MRRRTRDALKSAPPESTASLKGKVELLRYIFIVASLLFVSGFSSFATALAMPSGQGMLVVGQIFLIIACGLYLECIGAAILLAWITFFDYQEQQDTADSSAANEDESQS